MNATFAVAAIVLQAIGPGPDSVEALRKRARRAEAEFERLARQLAPVKFTSMNGTQCDEIVGRFCLRYDVGEVPAPPEEPPRVSLARRVAIEALRHAYSYRAEELATSGPLIRYLVEDDRAAEAASAARTFAALSRDSIWGPLLLGFALHAAQDDTAAERLFGEALGRMGDEDRRRIENVEWLLSAADRGRYRGLDESAKRAFEEVLWAFADPLYLTPGNERRNQHIARHVWSRVLERAPVVAGMVRWGRDLEELTVRYGIPQGRTRSPGTAYREGSLVEHFDPDQLAYVPEDLLARGPPPTPLPGETWALENPRNRSGFAPATLRKLRPLEHQLTRIPAGDSVVLRVDAAMPLDSTAAGADSVLAGLWVLADGRSVVGRVRRSVRPRADTARFSLEITVPPGEFLYSAEGLEPVSRLAGRARYAADLPARGVGLALSDPILAHSFAGAALPAHRSDARVRPYASLVFPARDTVGLFAEVHGLRPAADGRTRYRVELSLRRADRASLPARVVSWLGRRLGLSSPEVPPRLSWEAAGTAGSPAIVAVDLPLDVDGEGLFILAATVTDLASGERAESDRLLRIGDPR